MNERLHRKTKGSLQIRLGLVPVELNLFEMSSSQSFVRSYMLLSVYEESPLVVVSFFFFFWQLLLSLSSFSSSLLSVHQSFLPRHATAHPLYDLPFFSAIVAEIDW